MGKGEIAHHDQILLFPHECLRIIFPADTQNQGLFGKAFKSKYCHNNCGQYTTMQLIQHDSIKFTAKKTTRSNTVVMHNVKY